MNQQQKPLVAALEQFEQQRPISFHVPGHKNGLLSTLPQAYRTALVYDVTELTTLDDLHYAEECIAEAQQLLQETYKSDASFFLVNGSTVGNLAMIYATCTAGDVVLVQRNAHKSVFHALELVGVIPVLLAPCFDPYTKTAGHVEMETVERAISQYPHAKALILTNPTYYGVVHAALREIVNVAHEASIPVLVDEAHGAHLQAHASFPNSALQCGADIVVQSAHKTLSAMTMASFLHVRSDIIQSSQVAKYLRMLQSSSPSYMLLASLDDARHVVANYTDDDFAHMMQLRARFIEALQRTVDVITPADPLKLCVRVIGYSGFQLKEALEAQHVFIELADNEQVLLVLPLLTKDQHYPYDEAVEKIERAVEVLQQQTPQHKEAPMLDYTDEVTALEPYEDGQCMLAPFSEAIGQKSAEYIVPYPPGIPLLVKGERITTKHIEAIERYVALQCPIQGEHRIEEQRLYIMEE